MELWDGFKRFFQSVFNMETFFPSLMAAIIVILVAVAIVFVGKKVTARLLPLQDTGGERTKSKMAQTLRILVDTVLTYSIYLIAGFVILYIFNIRLFNAEDVKTLGIMIIQALVIIVVAKAVLQISQTMIDHWFTKDREALIGEKRAKTLGALLLSFLRYFVLFIAGIMVLQTFGVQTGSIIASAGIAGLALGFGAQSLVKDIISGFFILFENQFSVGEYVTVAGVTGTVEELGLRSTTIKEWTGHVYTIPNGEIVEVKNYDRNPILAVITVNIAYQADIDGAIRVMEDTLEKLYRERDYILALPTILGVTALKETSVEVMVTAQCASGFQWAVEREMRKCIKTDLQAAGFPSPYPAMFVHHPEEIEELEEKGQPEPGIGGNND